MEIDTSIDSFSVNSELNLCNLIGGSIPSDDTFENDNYLVYFLAGEIIVVEKGQYRLERQTTLADSNVYFLAHRYLHGPNDTKSLASIKPGAANGSKADKIIRESWLSQNSYKDTEVAISALEVKYNKKFHPSHT